jgi:hypothetical protein
LRHKTHAALALFALALVALATGCGGGGGGGGGGAGDLAAEANDVQQLLDQLKALPTTASTPEEFSQQLSQIRTQLQTEIQEIPEADAPDELATERDKLANRLRSLRTNLNRIQGQLDAGDLESAQAAVPLLLVIAQIEETIENIRAGSGGGSR